MKAARPWMWAAALAAGWPGWAAEAPEPPEPRTFPLKPVVRKPDDDSGFVQLGSRYIRLDRNGQGEIPFATASGKLRFKVIDEKTLVDRNDDGQFDPADGEGVAGGQAAEVPVKLAGKVLQYALSVEPMGNDPRQKLRLAMVCGRTHLEAQVGEMKVCLLDSNLNGRFGDREDPKGKEGGDFLQIGSEGDIDILPITRYIELDGRIHELRILGECEAISLQLHTGPTATLKLDAREGWKFRARLSHKEGAFVASVETGAECLLLPGPYEIEWVAASSGFKKGDQGEESRAEIEFYGGGEQKAPVDVKEGENSLGLGPPFKLEFAGARSTQDASDVEITEVSLVGAGGERYRADNYGTGRRRPQTSGILSRWLSRLGLGDNGGVGREDSLSCYVRSGAKAEKVSTLRYG